MAVDDRAVIAPPHGTWPRFSGGFGVTLSSFYRHFGGKFHDKGIVAKLAIDWGR